MLKGLRRLLTQDSAAKIVILIFAILTVWWGALQYLGYEQTSEFRNLIWAALYQAVALYGGVWGLVIGFKSWGGTKSVIGRAVLAFSIGLLLQSFGQTIFSFYNLVLEVDIPYPSIADIGFFGSIPLYIYGTVLLARASGVAVSMRSYASKTQAMLIPLVMLALSYYFFLRGYEIDWTAPLRMFLDFGYPLGQAIYVSIAILTYLLSKRVLGGVMKGKVIWILLALVVQYIADYNFLFQTIHETWLNGGYGDFIYMLSYLFMALGLLQLKIEYIRSDNN